MSTNYYDLLGVNKDASDDEIKKSYKKLAMKYHPDRNKNNKEDAEKKFKDISNAYNILSDKNKKQIYDQFGEEGLQGGMGAGNFNPFSMFEEMFGNNQGFNFNMNHNNHNNNNKPEVKKIKISLNDLYIGKTMSFNITRTVLDESKKNLISSCNICNGSGVEVKIQQFGPMIQQMQGPCSACGGTGKTFKNEYLKTIKEKISITIEKGMCNGEQIILKNKGNFNVNSMKNNDLVFVIIEEEHSILKRIDNNLILGLDINLIDALVGFSFVFKHLDNSEFIISSNNIIKNDEIKIIKNKGMPFNNHSNIFGDLIIKFNIIYPNSIDQQHQNILKNILPNTIFNNIDNRSSYSNYYLEDYNKKKYEKMENDFQNNDGGPPQCHQQ